MRHLRTRCVLVLASFAVLVGSFAACQGDSMGDRFARSLYQATANGHAIQLNTLASVDFDRVMVFRDYWRGSDINRQVGMRVVDDGDHVDENQCMWIFFRDGRPTLNVVTSYTSILADLPPYSSWNNDVWLRPVGDGDDRMTLSASSSP